MYGTVTVKLQVRILPGACEKYNARTHTIRTAVEQYGICSAACLRMQACRNAGMQEGFSTSFVYAIRMVN